FGVASAGVLILTASGAVQRGAARRAGDLAGLVGRAEDAIDRRDLELARATAQQAAALGPHDAVLHLLLGRISVAAGGPVEAAEQLRRAQRLDPLLVAAYRVLGYALVATGRFAEAVEQWDQWERLAAHSESE